MTKWILDTDCYSLIQRGNPQIIDRIQQIDPNQIYITIITVQEQIKGRFKNIDEAKNSPKLIVSYGWLQETISDFDRLSILPFDEKAYLHYDQFRTQQLRVGSQDLRIAAITMANEGVLVTRNRHDFEKIPNLSIIDWALSKSAKYW
jgi:tRNA(fMet)-specific endonuclease VapC